MGMAKTMVNQQNKTLSEMPNWQKVQFEQFGYPTDFGKTPVGAVATEAGKIAAEIAKNDPKLIVDQARVAAEMAKNKGLISPEQVEQTVQAVTQSIPNFVNGYQDGSGN